MTTVRVKTETEELDMSGNHELRGRFRFYPYQADKAGKAGILKKHLARVKVASPHDIRVDRHFSSRYSFTGINNDSASILNRKDPSIMKKLIITFAIGLMAVTAAHAQQAVVIERPGVLSDLVSAAGAIVALPLAAVEGIVVGTAEAAGTLVHGSTTVVVVPSAKPVPVPIAVTPASVMVTPSATVKTAPAVAPSTTIITMHGDGTVTTVTRHASAYELEPVIVAPVDPNHRVGTSPYANPYVYRYR